MEAKKYDITAIGECLIDFISRDSKTETLLYEGNAGGAPANVLACASKMGDRTAIFSKVGQDRFGDFLKETLSAIGIDTSGIIKSKDYPTTLAFVSLDRTGNRSFRFYRKETADIRLTVNEVNMEKLTNTKIVHFGSVSMTMEPSRSTTLTAIQRAKGAGAKISFDPNLRQMMWDNLQDAKEQILRGIAFSDYVKLSEEELIFLTDGNNLKQRMLSLLHNNKMSFLVVTLGSQGCLQHFQLNMRLVWYLSPAYGGGQTHPFSHFKMELLYAYIKKTFIALMLTMFLAWTPQAQEMLFGEWPCIKYLSIIRMNGNKMKY